MIDTETKILITITIIVSYFTLKWGIIFLLFWVILYLFAFFCTSLGIDVELQNLKESEIYFQEYTCNYKDLYIKLKEYNMIRQKFKLDSAKYIPFGMFYDDPTKVMNVEECRAVLGIFKEKSTERNDELHQWLRDNGFKYDTIPETQCVLGTYNSLFSIQNSFIWISKLIIELTSVKFIRRVFIPKWKEKTIKLARINYMKTSGVMELFKHGRIELYIPVEKERCFFLHSQQVAPNKSRKKK
jgi:hypothetical protein